MRIIGRLGDASPAVHGGGLVLKNDSGDETIEWTHGSECEEGSFAPEDPEPRCEACGGSGEVRSADADEDEMCEACHGKGHLFEFQVYRVDVPKGGMVTDQDGMMRTSHLEDEFDWVDFSAVAKTIGATFTDLLAHAASDDPLRRALVIEAIGSHYGWFEMDHDPMTLNEFDLEARWAAYEKK